MIRVFAIDDHAAFLATVALVVEAMDGFELCGSALSAEAVLAEEGAASTSAADMILVDYQLPGMNGLDLAHQLRSQSAPMARAERRPLVILMSSYDLDALPAATVSWRSVDEFMAKAELSPAVLLDYWRAHEAREVTTGDGTT